MSHIYKFTILLILLSFSNLSSAGVLGYIDTGRVNSQVIMAGVTPSIIDAGDTEFDIIAMVRPGFYPLQNVTIGQGKGVFNNSLTHINTLANGDQIWKKTLGFDRNAFGQADLIIKWGSGDGQYFIRATDTNQQSFDANSFPLIKIDNAPYQIVNIDTSKDSNLLYNSTKRNLPQIIMAGVSPAVVDIVDTSFDILTIVRPGVLPIKKVIIKQGGNNLFSYLMDKKADLSNGDQLWGTNFSFPQGSFGIQTIPIVWGSSLNEFTIEVIDSAQQKAPGYPLLRSGNYPLVTSVSTCKLPQVLDPKNTCVTPVSCTFGLVRDPLTNTCMMPTVQCTAPQVRDSATNTCVSPDIICTSPQLRDPATNTCYTPNVTCTAPQVRNAQTNTCYTPDVICYAPQLRNAQTNTCYTPDVTCTAPQVRNAQTNTCYTPDVICNSPQLRDPATNTCYTPACPTGKVRDASTNVCVTPTSSGAYTIGSKGPAGGIVFFVESSGLHGLEAKAIDEANYLTWAQAITAASAYGPGWHLPSKDELNQLYLQKTVVGGFASNDGYWSSTEYDSTSAWAQLFTLGSQYTNYYAKDHQLPVRAVRAF